MTDFRGTVIGVGDTVVYVGRQDMKATLVEAKVIYANHANTWVQVRPTRSSNPLGQPTGKLVTLTVLRKIVVIRKARRSARS